MDLCGDTTTNQELPRSPNQELTPAEEEGGWIPLPHTLLEKRKPQKGLRRKRIQTCQEYEQMSYPVENPTILGRALKTSQYPFIIVNVHFV
jgi:hypothetical protein